MNILSKRIYWTQNSPGPKLQPNEAHAVVVVIGDGGMFSRESREVFNELRTLCTKAGTDDVVVSQVKSEPKYNNCVYALHKTILPKQNYPGWENMQGEPNLS